MPRDDVVISPDDRGFRFGDGVFETIAIIHGTPYLWDAHMARLQRGLDVLSINADIGCLRGHVDILARKNQCVKHGIARIMVTRGCGSRGYLPVEGIKPTCLLDVLCDVPPMAQLPRVVSPLNLYVSQWRRFPPECLPCDAKIMQGMNATLARMEAVSHGADEALMLSVNDMVAESSSGNLFWQDTQGRLYTPALSTGCLAGTMRARLMQLWPREVIECTISLEELTTMPAMVFTNSLRGAVPVRAIAGSSADFPQSEELAARCNQLIIHDVTHTH